MGFDRLKGRVAIVTGGARGIGEGCCEGFAEEGAKVVIADIQDADGNAVAKRINGKSGHALYVHADIGKEEDIANLYRATMDAFGTVDILINNAGVELFKDALNTTTEEWEYVMGVDLRGVFLCSRYCLPAMLERGKGAIVNISSVHAIQTIKGITAYAAAKGGVAAMTRNMALDYAPKVRINTIFPGFIATTIWDRFVAAAPDPEKLVADVMAMQPMERLGTSRDIAQCALFLVSDESSWVTGATFVVDGGLTARLYN